MGPHDSDQIFTYGKKKIEFGEIPDPLIRIPLKTQKTWAKVWFLVDSGADVTVVPIPLALWLDIPFSRSEKSTSIAGVGNTATKAYAGALTLKFGKKALEVRCYFVESSLDLMLLGRLDVFDRFTIVFDSKKQEIRFV